MLQRISRHQMFMEIARVVSKRSTCSRLNVGAVITANDRIVSIGYNGAPPGVEHCQGNACPGRIECHETVHAEINALDYVPRGVVPERMYVTNSPCPACADAIADSLIKETYFEVPYRKVEHLAHRAGFWQLTPAGYLVEWSTQRIWDLV